MTAPQADAIVYELTVAGRLGPVLRAMLEPVAATTSCEYVTIRWRDGQEGGDLVDLVQLLGSRGLDAVTVSAID